MSYKFSRISFRGTRLYFQPWNFIPILLGAEKTCFLPPISTYFFPGLFNKVQIGCIQNIDLHALVVATEFATAQINVLLVTWYRRVSHYRESNNDIWCCWNNMTRDYKILRVVVFRFFEVTNKNWMGIQISDGSSIDDIDVCRQFRRLAGDDMYRQLKYGKMHDRNDIL